MKLIVLGIVVVAALVSPMRAEDAKTGFISPNGKYGVRMAKDAEGLLEFDLINVKTSEVFGRIDAIGNPYNSEFNLVWAPDSQRAAAYCPSRKGGWTYLYVHEGATFRRIELPDMPKLDWKTRDEAKSVLNTQIPTRWPKPNVLLIDHHAEDEDGVTGAQIVALTFNAKNEITVKRVPKR